MDEFTIAGVVTLYHPDADVASNIETYINSLDCLFVINNGGGEPVIETLKKNHHNLEILDEKENMGIAYPLNQALALCRNKYDFLLTMDQDSAFYNNDIKKYFGQIPEFDWKHALGIGPKLIRRNEVADDYETVSWEESERVITSGNIIKVSNAIDIGGYNEDLFIDEVDYDFCYRGIEHGLKMYLCTGGIHLRHSIGNTKKVSFLGFKFNTMNHGPVRKYYIIRNRLYVYKRFHNSPVLDHKLLRKVYIISNFKYIIKIILAEDDKVKKLQYCALGAFDFCRHRMGKKF